MIEAKSVSDCRQTWCWVLYPAPGFFNVEVYKSPKMAFRASRNLPCMQIDAYKWPEKGCRASKNLSCMEIDAYKWPKEAFRASRNLSCMEIDAYKAPKMVFRASKNLSRMQSDACNSIKEVCQASENKPCVKSMQASIMLARTTRMNYIIENIMKSPSQMLWALSTIYLETLEEIRLTRK